MAGEEDKDDISMDNEESREEAINDDEISAGEGAFMRGYDETEDDEKEKKKAQKAEEDDDEDEKAKEEEE